MDCFTETFHVSTLEMAFGKEKSMPSDKLQRHMKTYIFQLWRWFLVEIVETEHC